MNIYKYLRIFSLLGMLLLASVLTAQEKQEITSADYTNTQVEMADEMRSNGKIYVVVAVIVSIFAGLITYTVIIDRKISKLEKEVKD